MHKDANSSSALQKPDTIFFSFSFLLILTPNRSNYSSVIQVIAFGYISLFYIVSGVHVIHLYIFLYINFNTCLSKSNVGILNADSVKAL